MLTAWIYNYTERARVHNLFNAIAWFLSPTIIRWYYLVTEDNKKKQLDPKQTISAINCSWFSYLCFTFLSWFRFWRANFFSLSYNRLELVSRFFNSEPECAWINFHFFRMAKMHTNSFHSMTTKHRPSFTLNECCELDFWRLRHQSNDASYVPFSKCIRVQ